MSTDPATRTDGFLNNKHHYDFEESKLRNYRDRNIQEEGFSKWSQNHMYRTSYVSAYTDKPVEFKSLAMPKYGGYIPYVVPQNIHAKSYTPITKQCFANENFSKNKDGLSTTGHNFRYDANIDQSLVANSSKYGKSNFQRNHPSWSVDRMISTSHDTFRDPSKMNNPTFKDTEKFLQTQKKFTKTSGFAQNHDPFDGTGFEPIKILNGRRDISQYRQNFNDDKAFHRNTSIQKSRVLPRKSANIRAD